MNKNSQFDAVIIAGGLGTRSQQSEIPKSLQRIGELSVVETQIEVLIRANVNKIIIVGGFLFHKLETHLAVHAFRSRIILVNDHALEGTLSALSLGLEHTSSRNIAVILGDIFFDLDFRSLVEEFVESNAEVTVLVHPNSHPYDSDLLRFSESQRKIEFLPKDRKPSSMDGNIAVSGLYLFQRSTLENFRSLKGDISTKLVPLLAEKGKLDLKMVTNYISDTGTPSRLQKVNDDVKRGYSSARSAPNKGAIFLDLDDTLIPNIEVKNSDSIYEVNGDTASLLGYFNGIGIPLIVISNQPGVAKGFFTIEDFEKFLAILQSKLAERGCWIDDWLFCFHHPESGWEGEVADLKIECSFRKPGEKLLEFACKKHQIDPKKSIFFGDSLVDQIASDKMGITFMLVGADGIEYRDGRRSTSQALKEFALR